MSNSSRYIPKLNDRDVARAFQSVAKKYAEVGAKSTFNDQFGGLDEDAIGAVEKFRGHVLTHATLRVGPCTWQWLRLGPNSNDDRSATHDRLNFSWNQQQSQPDRVEVAAISADLDSALARPLVAAARAEGGTEVASHGELLLAMESVAAQILVDATNHRERLELAYIEKERSLNSRVDELRERELERLRLEKERIDSELAGRAAALDERQAALDALQAKLDDRNNTHVRRDIRSSLLALTKERLANFAVSKETRLQYWAVHLVAVLGLLALATGSIAYGVRIVMNPDTNTYPPEVIALAIKSGALAAAAIALGSWYLGWLNRWLQRIADAEFKLQQFRLDIERASWLAETVLEWKATSPEPFPELLAARLSTGLFQSSTTDFDDPKTPVAHLAEALFGAASSAKLRLGEQEINLGKV